MPRKYYGKKRKTYRPRYKRKNQYWYNKKYSVAEMASTALQTANAVRKLINVEFKHFDTSTSAAPTSTGSIYALSTIPQGDNSSSRDGSSLKLQSLTIHGNLRVNTTATSDQRMCQFRCIILQANADTAPTFTTLLDQSNNPLSMRNLDYTGDEYFRILSDKTILLDTYHPNKHITHQINTFPQEHIEYDNTDTAGTNYKKGGIYICLLSDQATYPPTYEFESRIRFTDN